MNHQIQPVRLTLLGKSGYWLAISPNRHSPGGGEMRLRVSQCGFNGRMGPQSAADQCSGLGEKMTDQPTAAVARTLSLEDMLKAAAGIGAASLLLGIIYNIAF